MSEGFSLDPHQAAELGQMAQVLRESLDPAIDKWLRHNDLPSQDSDGRYKTAALLTILDAFAFMAIAINITPAERQAAAKEHCRNLRRTLREYHQETGR